MKIKYIADDGTEFASKQHCQEYERMLKEKRTLAIQQIMCELDQTIWQKYRGSSDMDEVPKHLASVWLRNDIVSVLSDEEIDAEQRLQEIIVIINETDYGSEILDLIKIQDIREEVKIRRDWPNALQKVKSGGQLSRNIGYRLSSVDLKKLALLHQSNRCRKKDRRAADELQFPSRSGKICNSTVRGIPKIIPNHNSLLRNLSGFLFLFTKCILFHNCTGREKGIREKKNCAD